MPLSGEKCTFSTLFISNLGGNSMYLLTKKEPFCFGGRKVKPCCYLEKNVHFQHILDQIPPEISCICLQHKFPSRQNYLNIIGTFPSKDTVNFFGNFTLSLGNSLEILNSVISTFNAHTVYRYRGFQLVGNSLAASTGSDVTAFLCLSSSEWGRCSEGHFRNQSTIFFLVCFGKDMSAILQ
jgi:hypothetical protein